MKNAKKSVLVLCPQPERTGGVANYYNVLKNHFSEKEFKIHYFFTGKRSDRPSITSRIAYSVKDLLYLLVKLPKYELVHLNPSLDMKSIFRDGLYHLIAKKILRKKTIIFFRGWHLPFEKNISSNFVKAFKILFDCNCIIVLANSFRDTLIKWGYDPEIIRLETTTVDNYLCDDFSIEDRIKRIESNKKIQLLFLARLEREKGILETIEAFSHLNREYPNMRLVVAGIGSSMDEACQFAKEVVNNKVSFVGYIRGEKKKSIFLTSDIYVFPTYHSEGMPNSVLEAMALGLPIVTRPVGALKDFFKVGEHGYMIESKNPADIASCINKIISDKKLWKLMANAAHEYAVEHFIGSKVAMRLENIYTLVLNREL